ncbi:hypothetical protein [Sebaldella sp. S0638]|uniref:hypothetical protein n=1 Tax=Sebaldella sp. S0638 TaxID=2957809 RepID=UPI00209ED1A8|nr:hypothetical protein [Sebaldella sp. S0638]MCP1224298.1 hypothetical protein [Sebaldella sp. S0638]
MHFDDNAEIINPVLKIIREYEMIEKAELAHYNFQKEQKKRLKRKFKKSKQYKVLKTAAIYIGIFMMISAFKMNAVYAVMDLNMQLKILDSEITESEKVLNSFNMSDIYQMDLAKVKDTSKKMGFTEDKKVAYVYFK